MTAFSNWTADYLTWCSTHGWAPLTVRGRRYHLAAFAAFLAAREVTDPETVTPSLVESYQRHLFHHRTREGRPTTFHTQADRLNTVKGFFAWATKAGRLPYDPAVSLVLPKQEQRLPAAVLSPEEAEAVLGVPDTTTVLGLRDRAMLEVLYSSAIRRQELVGLRVRDVDLHRGALFIRLGKGARDRHVPIGERALAWVTRYLERARPALVGAAETEALFLSRLGGPIAPDSLSKTVTGYLRAGAPAKPGSCHLFRHTAATLMLDAGADVRHVAEMLGHAKLETTMIYTRVSMEKLRSVHAATHPAERPRRLQQS